MMDIQKGAQRLKKKNLNKKNIQFAENLSLGSSNKKKIWLHLLPQISNAKPKNSNQQSLF